MNANQLGQLMDRHLPALVLYARQWSAAPDDVVQDAFLKLVRQKRSPNNVVAWLYRVVRNAAIDSARSRKRRKRTETVAAEQKSGWFCSDIGSDLDAAEATRVLQTLPLEEREVVIAHLWGNLTYEQIADVVGCSASTAHRRYLRGLESLRERLRIPCPTQENPEI